MGYGRLMIKVFKEVSFVVCAVFINSTLEWRYFQCFCGQRYDSNSQQLGFSPLEDFGAAFSEWLLLSSGNEGRGLHLKKSGFWAGVVVLPSYMVCG